MRPDNLSSSDLIDKLLDKSWENPPTHLERQLLSIPVQVAMVQRRQADRLISILHAILTLWGLGLVTYFWSPIEEVIIKLSTQILGYSVLSTESLANPIWGLICLVGVAAVWVWQDFDRQPRTHHFSFDSE